MVKLDSNFKSCTATWDSLKISLPKVRDDPLGFSSSLITSVCPDQSNFRGSTPDSPVLTSPKTRAKPYGSLLARGCSDVQDRAISLPISVSLGCSTDQHTATLMVIAHKVGCYTGKASLYTWNSFIPEDVSSVLVDLMAGLVMNSYSLFPDYGTLRCGMDSEDSYRLQYRCRQGEQLKFAVDPCCLDLCDCLADCHNILLLESLACEVYELMSMNFRGLPMLAPLVIGSFINLSTATAALVQHLRCWFHLFSLDKQQADATIDFWLQYCKTFTGFKDSTSCLGMLFAVAEKFFWFNDSHIWSDVVCDDVVYFLGTRYGCQELDRLLQEMELMSEISYFLLRIMQVPIQIDRTEISGLELLLKQSLPQAFLHILKQDYDFFRCIYVVISGRFGLLTEIPYGSLPRPPDVSFPSNSYGFLHVQDVMAYILRGSIKYDDMVYTFR
ncbi:unnamed protein product [Eruca vesicaria subsp. sativa]|uniref:Uncharacterized protein n=1 Tax=Eruca vesicaria subsp. sativa TaxID=29727 RepID=A0ABC8K6B7_ERUVS|nr:unnamed protein product [Eruca vesicaria subsp. sativa]